MKRRISSKHGVITWCDACSKKFMDLIKLFDLVNFRKNVLLTRDELTSHLHFCFLLKRSSAGSRGVFSPRFSTVKLEEKGSFA